MLPKAQINAMFCLKGALGEIQVISLMKIISIENEDHQQIVLFFNVLQVIDQKCYLKI